MDLLYSPAADRNKEPILTVLRKVLPESGRVLEIASGSGQHIVHFAAELPSLCWLPSEPQAEGLRSIEARISEAALTNVAAPLKLDVTGTWPELDVDALIVANMLHISPPETLPALMRGASGVMPRGGVLTIYGPFKRNGEHTASSNERFDASLRERDSRWGIRDLETVVDTAQTFAIELQQVVAMPANNLLLVFTLPSQREPPGCQ
jgi:cyclopropane fatty-acyl-phospholipid synthase-like methyltransferase